MDGDHSYSDMPADPSPPDTEPFFLRSDEQARASMEVVSALLLRVARRSPSMLHRHPNHALRHGIFTALLRDRTPPPDRDLHADANDDMSAYGGGGFGAVPASGVAMACLPERTVGESEAMVKKAECAVCLEPYEAGATLRTMPCSHGFHESCIFGWLRVSCLCPLCRFALPAETEDSEEEDSDEEDGEGG